MSDDAARREATRIRAEYARRRREVPAGLYDPTSPAHLFLRHGQERALVGALRRHGLVPLAGREILEVGCGAGRWLELLATLGAERRRLAGVDLDAGRLASARAAVPAARLAAGDAARLPFVDGRFDVVLQSTVVSSILDPAVRRLVAGEMLRVLSPGGAVLWYDFVVGNPRNPHVRGVSRREVARLFPGCAVDLRRATLAPPLARRLVPRLRPLAVLLESLAVLDTHVLGVVRRLPR